MSAGWQSVFGPNMVGPAAVAPSQYVINSQIREKLTTSRVYYVRSDGNDSNSGLVNDASGAFLTLQHMVTTVLATDANGFNITAQVSSGTFAGFDMNGPVPGLGNGTFLVTGDTTTPSNVIVTSSSLGNSIGAFYGAVLQISGLSMRPTTTFVCLQAGLASMIICADKMDFGAALYHLEAQQGGAVIASGITYSISGSPSVAHVRPNNLGYVDTGFATVNFSADITCTQFALSELNSVYKSNIMTFNLNGHTVTGSRYTARNGGVINTGLGTTGSTTYFPGSTPGTGTNFGASPYGLYT